jgi:hypothetical protein
MAAYNQRFWTEDTIAAAILAGTAMALLQGKLDAIAGRLDSPTLHLALQLWPMLLIIAGLILLMKHPTLERPSGAPEPASRRPRGD